MVKAALETVTSFETLIDYLRDELEWPLPENANINNTTFTYTAAELGLKEDVIGGGIEFRQLRPMTTNQPWGIFFLNLPHKDLPQTLVRNILGKLTMKKRASANDPMRPAFAAHDLLFITSTGNAEERRLAFAHFQDDPLGGNAASLKVLGWEADDTPRRAELTQRTVEEKLAWPDDEKNADAWRAQWGSAFTDRPREAVRTSKELAKTLAALARRIRDRVRELIKAQNDSGSLVKLHKAFKDALIHDLTPDAFADTYAQTITYGLLSTAMSRASGALTQDDMLLSVATTSPFLRDMLKTFIEAGGRKPGADGDGLDFDELGVGEVVEFLRNVNMTAVLADFDQKNSDKDPVIHLYELFIHEYDKAQKFQRGVFYTPRQVVGFIVRSVDEVLRTELGLEDGLASTDTWGDVITAHAAKDNVIALPDDVKAADTFVRILDPATGTGTFLVETVELINKTMVAKWQKAGNSAKDIAALWNAYVPEHLLPRLYGFELMMAPYAIAHMKLGLKLWDTGYRFASDARLRVHLTNALEPARDFATQFVFIGDAMANEARDANAAKKTHFTAVIGNPPYKGNSANPSKDKKGKLTPAGELIQHYFFVDGEPLGEKNAKWVNNDYVKFLAFAEKRIKDSGIGAIGYITSNSWLDSPTFRGVRAELLDTFPKVWIGDLFGNTGSKTTDQVAANDENVFEITEGVCTTIGLSSGLEREVHYCAVLGPLEGKGGKLSILSNAGLAICNNSLKLRLPLRILKKMQDEDVSEYDGFPALTNCIPSNVLGFQTHRDHFSVRIDRASLEADLTAIIAAKNEDLESIAVDFGLADSTDWSLDKARKKLGQSWKNNLIECAFRPFDIRTVIYNSAFVDRPRPLIRDHVVGRDALVINASRQLKENGYRHVLVSNIAPESCLISDRSREGNYTFPLLLHSVGTEVRTLPNIAPAFAKRVAVLTGLRYDDGVDAPAQATIAGVIPAKPEQPAMFSERRDRGDGGVASFGPRDLFDWIYTVLHSPAYRARYADYLKSDFARIPLPKDNALFQALIPVGTKLVALHLLDANATPELVDPKSIRLAGSGEARVSRKASDFENDAWVGGRMYINETRWFETVPECVANFHIGGYRPARKWLKDRTAKGGKKSSNGRILTDEDVLHYRRMIIAMGETVDLMAEIDAVIESNGGWPNAFRGTVADPDSLK
jgi:Type ISP C-terminal specificity domain